MMHRYAVLLLLVILLTSEIVAQNQNGNHKGEIFYLDLRGKALHISLPVVVCQGLLHRKLSRPVVFVMLEETDLLWLRTMQKELPEYSWHERKSEELIAWAITHGYLRKQVFYNPSQLHAINNVVMLCALADAIPVTTDIGLETAFDCRDRWSDQFTATRWAIDELLAQCDRDLVACQTATPHLQDLIVSRGIFSLYLDASMAGPGRRLFQEVLEGGHYREDVSVIGYHRWQEVVAKCTRTHAQIALVSDFCSNLSFYGQFPPVQKLQQPEKKQMSYDREKTYVCLVVSDGDNMQIVLNSIRLAFASPVRGKFPISWTISNRMMEFAPPVLEWFYRQAHADSDSFLMGPSGYGYVHPTLVPDHRVFARKTEHAAATLGMEGYVHWDEGYIHWEGYDHRDEMIRCLRDYSGTHIRSVFTPVSHSLPPFVEDVAVIPRWARWEGTQPQRLAEQLSSPHLRGQLGYLCLVHSTPLEQVEAMVDSLAPHVEIVGYREMGELFTQRYQGFVRSKPDITTKTGAIDARAKFLVAQLKDDNPATRCGAVQMLGEIGEDADAAISALVAILDDENRSLRNKAVWALRRIGARAIPVLCQAVHHRYADVRHSAVWALAETVDQFPDTIAALIAALEDTDSLVREKAVWALRKAGNKAIPFLRDTTRHPRVEVRTLAVELLQRIKMYSQPRQDREPVQAKDVGNLPVATVGHRVAIHIHAQFDIAPLRVPEWWKITLSDEKTGDIDFISHGERVRPGSYLLEIECPGYHASPQSQRIVIPDDHSVYHIHAKLYANPRGIAGGFHPTFWQSQTQAILVDGEEISAQDVFAVGREYTIEVKFAQYRSITTRLWLPPGEGTFYLGQFLPHPQPK